MSEEILIKLDELIAKRKKTDKPNGVYQGSKLIGLGVNGENVYNKYLVSDGYVYKFDPNYKVSGYVDPASGMVITDVLLAQITSVTEYLDYFLLESLESVPKQRKMQKWDTNTFSKPTGDKAPSKGTYQ